MEKTNHARFIPNILLLNLVLWITYIDETYPIVELLELYLAEGFGQNITKLIFDLNVSALVSENGILDQRDR
jgi:hypothetical protein